MASALKFFDKIVLHDMIDYQVHPYASDSVSACKRHSIQSLVSCLTIDGSDIYVLQKAHCGAISSQYVYAGFHTSNSAQLGCYKQLVMSASRPFCQYLSLLSLLL